MNKQEIEKALSWVKEVINHQVFERATYEDTYGTGDLSEEERKEVYEEMDNNINLFKTIQCALTQQLNNGWIPVSERLPKEDGNYLVAMKHKEFNQTKVISMDFNGEFLFNDYFEKAWWEVTAWQPLPEPYKDVSE
jgi:hypothetical protein